MLEYFFKLSTQLLRLRRGPLCKHLDGLAAQLLRLGFTRDSGQRILSLTGKFNNFAFSAGVETAERIDQALVDRFINEDLTFYGTFRDAPSSISSMRHILAYLRDCGVLPKVVASNADEAFDKILVPYDHHLRDVRGLALVSRSQHLRYARRLLSWFRDRHGERPLGDMTGVDVLEFVTALADLHPSGSWRNNLSSLTRVFLRYLRWEGILKVDLDRVVPKVPHWRLSSLPRHLPWDQVQQLIGSVDTSNAGGLRDKAVLLVIATLGLRNQEVRNLHLGHIAWRTAEIRVIETKSRRERILPLPQEVGAAIAQYVLHGRPHLQLPMFSCATWHPRDH